MKPYNVNMIRGVACVSVPVGYLVLKHVSWERATASKKRMVVHQATFWATMAASLVLMHKSFYIKKNAAMRGLKQFAYLASASILPILGFEGGGKLGRAIYPHRPKAKPMPVVGFQKVYRPQFMEANLPPKNVAWLG